MKLKRIVNLLVFLLCAGCLVISVRLFYNMGVFVDEYNSTPALVCGGEFWLAMDWLRLGILAILSAVALVKLIAEAE